MATGGFLQNPEGLQLAPVYDCGGCLNNKKSDDQLLKYFNKGAIRNMALSFNLNFTYNGHHVKPFEFLQNNCNKYIMRAMELALGVNTQEVFDMIDSVMPIISNTRACYYKAIIAERFIELNSVYSKLNSKSKVSMLLDRVNK